ncbi:LysR family transcriptional regulator [Aurantimonas sp. 22II-16-19i]|uniref:LysR family transcriptional regulator n=1 Tax=Aurantimonas sp. 22II-16-19i TaxID=1317114 RepID=UPI0009F7F14E|nr:LysR family transcriptional regulator [Aurantimonas sp. 22II-16-19i]
MIDRLASMSVFVKVADKGSFAAAAAELDMSAQMVGKHVAALEARLGARLIARTTRRQSLTELGRAYRDQCRVVLAEAEAADALAEDVAAEPRGRLRINASVTFGSAFLAPLVLSYAERHPKVDVDLVLGDRRVDLIEEGFDAVVRIGELADSSLIARPLGPYRLVLAAAPAYLAQNGRPSHPRDLAGHECLVFLGSSETRSHTWRFRQEGEAEDVRVAGRLRMNDTRAMLHAAEAGAGIVMGPEMLIAPLVAAGRLERLLPGWDAPSWPMHVLYAPDRRPTAKLRAFLDMLVEAFPRR